MSKDKQLPIKKSGEGTVLIRRLEIKRMHDESKKMENKRARKTKFAYSASQPTVIDARKELEKDTVASRRDNAKLVADLTNEMSWGDLGDVLVKSMPMFVQKKGNYSRVLWWIYDILLYSDVELAKASIVRSVIALYPLTVNTETVNPVEISKWLRASRYQGIDLISILTDANQIQLCARKVMTDASRCWAIRNTLSNQTDKDAAANLSKSIIQLAGEKKYQQALDSLTVKYNTKHELVANTCRCAEFYRTTGLPVCCVTNHKNVRFMVQYRQAREYFKQTRYYDDLPLFYVKVESVTKSGISVKVTKDHDVSAYKNNRFLFLRRNDQADKNSSLRFTPGTNNRGIATGVISSPVHAQVRLIFEERLPVIADEVNLFLPDVCTNIVLQYVQSTLRELISNGE
jgi:hypothetical protein